MRRIFRGKRGAGEMRGRKTLRRAGIVLAFGALLSAGMLASGALGMVSIVTGTTDSSSTATDTAPPPSSTDTTPSTSTSTDTTSPLTTTDATSSTTTTTSLVFSPSITSDQQDYNPGATVTLTGAGWHAGEVVHITVNDDAAQPWLYSADPTADATGGFTLQFLLPTSFAATYTVQATGASGAVVTTTFTDGNVNIKTINVASASVDWRLFNNLTCQGGAASNGTITATSGGNGTAFPGGVSGTQSVRLTAANVTGAGFASWDSGNFTTGDPSTANPVCLVGTNGTQNVHLNYDTTPPVIAPVVSPASPNG